MAKIKFYTDEHVSKAVVDDDFLRLAAAGTDHGGIVYSTQENAVGEIIYGLMLIYQVLEAEEMVGHVEYL